MNKYAARRHLYANKRYRKGTAIDLHNWPERIARIEKTHGLKAAIKCACIVWWDHLSNNQVTGEPSPLAKWIDQYRFDESTEPNRDRLVGYLIELGYSEDRAMARSLRPKMSATSRSMMREHELRHKRDAVGAPPKDKDVSRANRRYQEDPWPAFMDQTSSVCGQEQILCQETRG